MNKNLVYIYSNQTPLSQATQEELLLLLPSYDLEVSPEYNEEVGLIICIGGDGTFLNCIHACRFPETPVVGINTGHLGFFQEMMPNQLERFLNAYREGQYTIQEVTPIHACVSGRSGEHSLYGINEILIQGVHAHIVHFAINIGETNIQNFIGDGVLISTAAGSTAYNYSLGGSLVAPDLDALQLTPVAPMNTNTYRCFRSSILYPAKNHLSITTMDGTRSDKLHVSHDGFSKEFQSVSRIEIEQANQSIHVVRLHSYDYWANLKSKLL